MKSINRLVLVVLVLMVGIVAASAQTARLDLENLKGLEKKASDVVEVNIDGKILNLVKRILHKVDDKDAQKVDEVIKGLEAIYVRVLSFENANEYSEVDVDGIRAQLNSPGWEKLANVRSKKKNGKIDVYTMFEGEIISGLAVIASDDKSVTVINVIGPIDFERLTELGGKFNIPNLGSAKDKKEDKKKDEKDN